METNLGKGMKLIKSLCRAQLGFFFFFKKEKKEIKKEKICCAELVYNYDNLIINLFQTHL
jgi:hypothetical protein